MHSYTHGYDKICNNQLFKVKSHYLGKHHAQAKTATILWNDYLG